MVNVLEQSAVAALRAQLRGDLIQPEDQQYEQARNVYNGMISRYPRLIVRPVDEADVIAAVNFTREEGLLLAMRGGGHNGAGLGTCDDGLVIDLSRMRGVRVDPANRTVRVQGGCVWGDVDHATHPFGMATPSGFISTTGVGGLTLGGGIGYLSRKYGLTIDNLLAVDLVLADGRFVTASSEENTDLYWAVRGGGGNFGVVTSFLFRTRPVSMVQAGPTLWPLEQAADVMRQYAEFIVHAPQEVNGWFAFLTIPPVPLFPAELHRQKMCGIVWCCNESAADTERHLKPMSKFGRPAFDHVGTMPFPVLQSFFDPLFPTGMQWYWRADFVNELSDEAIALHVKYGSQLPSPQSTMHLYPIDGAVHQVGPNDTAFSYRNSKWAEVVVGVDPDPANAKKVTDWAKAYWDALHPYSAGGAYVNFMMEEGQERVEATYRGNYKRLVAIKKKYDPNNLFRVNQNIRPDS